MAVNPCSGVKFSGRVENMIVSPAVTGFAHDTGEYSDRTTLLHHQNWHARLTEEPSGAAAEDPFPRTAMPKSAKHDQIGLVRVGRCGECVGD
jgi:hypothetical protein